MSGGRFLERLKSLAPLSASEIFCVVGLATLWPLFHISPYYPYALVNALGATELSAASAHHALYVFALLGLFVLVLVFRSRLQAVLSRAPFLIVIHGICGVCGSVLLLTARSNLLFPETIIGVGIVLVALSVVLHIFLWFDRAIALEQARVFYVVGLSYVLFSLIWILLLVICSDAIACILVGCPLISALCLLRAKPQHRQGLSFSFETLQEIPLVIILLCLILIYPGVLGVRVFTTIEAGQLTAGALDVGAHLITAVVGLLVVLVCLIYMSGRTYGLAPLIVLFSFFALIYMISLFIMMRADTLLVGKRMLVGAEHGLEIFLCCVMLCEAGPRRFCPIPTISVYALLVLVLPNFISIDLMYQSGLLGELAYLSSAVSLAEIASFCIAVLVVGLLIWFSGKSFAPQPQSSQSILEAKCRRACAGAGLTAREFDVAVLSYRGYSAKRIAEELSVSLSTVKFHQANIYQKLDIHTKQELITFIDACEKTSE